MEGKTAFLPDRFEGDYAVIEYNRKTFILPRELLPQEAMVGDVIQITVLMPRQRPT